MRKTAEEEARNIKYLAIVAASTNGGPLATALQEVVFSKAAAAELGKAASRTHPEKLTSRIFINANKAWSNPVKGSMTPFHALKRKQLIPGGDQQAEQQQKRKCLSPEKDGARSNGRKQSNLSKCLLR